MATHSAERESSVAQFHGGEQEQEQQQQPHHHQQLSHGRRGFEGLECDKQ